MTHYLMKNFASLCPCSMFRNNRRWVCENEEIFYFFISAAFEREGEKTTTYQLNSFFDI